MPSTPSSDEITEIFGRNFARALEKRPWLASELVRLKREGREGVTSTVIENGVDGEANRMEVDG